MCGDVVSRFCGDFGSFLIGESVAGVPVCSFMFCG